MENVAKFTEDEQETISRKVNEAAATENQCPPHSAAKSEFAAEVFGDNTIWTPSSDGTEQSLVRPKAAVFYAAENRVQAVVSELVIAKRAVNEAELALYEANVQHEQKRNGFDILLNNCENFKAQISTFKQAALHLHEQRAAIKTTCSESEAKVRFNVVKHEEDSQEYQKLQEKFIASSQRISSLKQSIEAKRVFIAGLKQNSAAAR